MHDHNTEMQTLTEDTRFRDCAAVTRCVALDGKSAEEVTHEARLSTLVTASSPNGTPARARSAERAARERTPSQNRMNVRRKRPFGSTDRIL